MFKKKNLVSGFTLVEMMVAMTILLVMLAGGYAIMMSGEQAWQATETNIRIQENLRQTLDRVSKELRESGSFTVGVAPPTMQVTISNNTGVNGSDIILFSMPVLCQTNTSVMDVNGSVAHWGAPLTWGCSSSSCMDADNSCATVDYKSVEYLIDNSNRLVRRVLNNAAAVVRTDIFAQNMSNLQATLSADQNVVTLSATVSITSALNRTITTTKSLDVRLRNRG